jgi:hypothetical protein
MEWRFSGGWCRPSMAAGVALQWRLVSPFSGGWCRPSVAIAAALATLAALTLLARAASAIS